MPRLLTKNGKMRRTGQHVYNFGIPAKKTCPSAQECKEYCYADTGFYKMKTVQNAYNFRYELTKKRSFVDIMNYEISTIPKITHVRIHDSGDFYSYEYMYKWIDIAKLNPDIIFYGYTKQVNMSKQLIIPKNMKLIYSYGGREDDMINPDKDRHSYIFGDLESLERSGYHDASHNDLEALNNNNHRIGLVIH